jgi:hypothetical protein
VRLLDEEDAPLPRRAAQKVLRPLEDEIPAQVRETDKIVVERLRRSLLLLPLGV